MRVIPASTLCAWRNWNLPKSWKRVFVPDASVPINMRVGVAEGAVLILINEAPIFPVLCNGDGVVVVHRIPPRTFCVWVFVSRTQPKRIGPICRDVPQVCEEIDSRIEADRVLSGEPAGGGVVVSGAIVIQARFRV